MHPERWHLLRPLEKARAQVSSVAVKPLLLHGSLPKLLRSWENLYGDLY